MKKHLKQLAASLEATEFNKANGWAFNVTQPDLGEFIIAIIQTPVPLPPPYTIISAFDNFSQFESGAELQRLMQAARTAAGLIVPGAIISLQIKNFA